MTAPAISREVREITGVGEWRCDGCGTVFYAARRRQRRFCSRACSASYLARQWWECDREGMTAKIAERNRVRQAPLMERFQASFVVAENGCWLWQKTRDRKGYGKISAGIGSRPVKAHRLSYQLFLGPIPAGIFVCHLCDTPACVNPAHLFLGTHADNTADMVRKGRASRATHPGETNPNAKLTEANVAAIRHSTERSGLLAEQYGVSRRQIWAIRKGLSWNAK